MASKRIVVSSRALGPRLEMTAYIYDDIFKMREAAERWNGYPVGMAQALAQLEHFPDRPARTVVRFCTEYLTLTHIAHEVHHAAAGLYGSTLGERVRTSAHLNHCNEPYTHLFSELLTRLLDKLIELGYDVPLRS